MDDEERYVLHRHAPGHLFRAGAVYMVTAGTYRKERFLREPRARDVVLQTLFEQAEHFGWGLEAWAVLENHYHFVAQGPEDATNLTAMLQRVHSATARSLNAWDHTPGRRIWYQYWDTCIMYEQSYCARLK